jgi:hypothetical protein
METVREMGRVTARVMGRAVGTVTVKGMGRTRTRRREKTSNLTNRVQESEGAAHSRSFFDRR